MLNWYRKHFVWKKVGYVAATIFNAKGPDFSAPVFLLMTGSGKRRIEIAIPPGIGKSSSSRHLIIQSTKTQYEVALWENGGPFPEGFKPLDDGFREVVCRMVDQGLMGEKS